jgi:NADP-dependent 3-hydroxy acid dehydrogenase YdfG
MNESSDTTADRSRNGRPVALVTGAGRGIGAAVARRLATDGFDVVVAARTEAEIDSVARDIEATTDATALSVPTDVTDPDAIAATVTATRDRFNRLDVAVVNAGTGERDGVALADLPLEQYHQVRATNADGAVYTARAVLPALRESAGALVFIGSFKGVYPSTSTPVYAATKWFVRGLAHSLAGRVGSDGVAVSLINPTGVPTTFGRELRGEGNDERLTPEATVSSEQVADAVAYAVAVDSPGAVAELNLFRQDVYDRF